VIDGVKEDYPPWGVEISMDRPIPDDAVEIGEGGGEREKRFAVRSLQASSSTPAAWFMDFG
jgi:hypothetical protein